MLNLLVPIDFSPNATNALVFACEFGKNSGSELLVFHSYPIQTKSAFLGLDEILALEKQEEANAQGKLEEFIRFFKDKYPEYNQVPIRFQTRLGFAVENVISLTDINSFDLIIMGTKGAGDVKTKLLGTNTAVVMDNVDCPVLAIPSMALWKKPENILVATDLLDFRFPEAHVLVKLAKIFDSTIHLIHVHHSDKERKKFEADTFTDLVKTDLNYDKIIVHEIMDDELENNLNLMSEKLNAGILAMTIKHRSIFKKIFYPDISRELFYHSRIPLLALHAKE